MKRSTVASLKRVNVENLTTLGVDRLAEILVSVAVNRPELKRRLRMELAAEQGADHLALEIDKRLGSLETSRSKVSWRQRPTFVRDLEALRRLIAERLAELDRDAALARLWLFMDVARRVGGRVKDKHGEVAEVFGRAAGDIGRLIGEGGVASVDPLVEAMTRNPGAWADWLPAVTPHLTGDLAAAALQRFSQRDDAVQGWMPLVRQLADAAGNVDAYRSTFTAQAALTPAVATTIGRRLLDADRVAEAGEVLRAAAPPASGKSAPDFDWETVWIEFLERSAQEDEAQRLRWASFERTLSAERARAFTRRLKDFDDVEAEQRAFDYAARHEDYPLALQFLMAWPALAEAARLILERPDDVRLSSEEAEAWAAKLRTRFPAAAHALLRRAAAAAFRRRDFATCDRLTHEADAIALPDSGP